MKLNIGKIRNNINNKYSEYLKKVRLISIFRLINFIIIIVFLLLTTNNNNIIYVFLSIFSIISFVFFVILHDNYYKKLDYYERYLKIIQEYEFRILNKWDKLPNNGEEYLNDDNIYLEDLDILGEHSLYQYLCSAKTKRGKDKLFESLNNLELSDNILKTRQEVIEELSNNIDFVLEFQVYLSKLEENINLDDSIKYLDNRDSDNFYLSLTILGNSISLIFLVFGLFNIISINIFYYIVIFKYLFSYLYSLFYKNKLDSINKLSRGLSKFNLLVEYISNTNFEHKKLNSIKDNMLKSRGIINKIDSLDTFSKLKDNFVANFIFNGIFTIDPYVLYKYSKLQNQDSKCLKDAIMDIEELENLISLSNIALIKEMKCIPIRDNGMSLEFVNLKHPLLDENVCVSNSYKNTSNVNIITGSNMSGKTSFLRTIGINLILANAGTYVCADSFSYSYFKIFTSMSVKDNIEKGISTFYGELLRIKSAIDYQEKNKNMIVLVDEIFKGTNYNDRILGAINVIKKLNKDNVILFITTHDFELCDTEVAKVNNYYFSEYYEDDNIGFDYKIREGKCKTTNAKYLMKRLNILDE